MPLLGEDPRILRGLKGKKVKNGLVFGKFMPPTKGHMFLMEHARQSCENLTIMVCTLPDEPIKGALRYQWVKAMFPDCNVVHHSALIQQEPAMSPEDPTGAKDTKFFEAWRDTIAKHCPGIEFDALFASETYGFRVADMMDVRFIPVDVERSVVPISGTKMRNNPLKYWDYLPDLVRPYFVKKVAVLDFSNQNGDELAKKLAKEFNTVCAGNYQQMYLDLCEEQMPDYRKNNFTAKDIPTILRGQIANENAMAYQANRLVFTSVPLPALGHKLCGDFVTSPLALKDFKEVESWARYDHYILIKPKKSGMSKKDYREAKAAFARLKSHFGEENIAYKIIASSKSVRHARKSVKAHFKIA